jgi:Zn-dependent metalloprotease
MKKQLFFVFVFLTSFGFSQNPSQKIQGYINNHSSKLNISTSEVTNWILESETSSETTGITNYLVMQTSNGVKIDNNFIYFWKKKGEIINEPEGFINNVSQKVNLTQPTISVVEGFSKALLKVNESIFISTVLKSENNKFKLSNGVLTEEFVSAELVYYPNENGIYY